MYACFIGSGELISGRAYCDFISGTCWKLPLLGELILISAERALARFMFGLVNGWIKFIIDSYDNKIQK